MSTTVEQLIADEDLATRVIAGTAGLNRRIDWAHVCELPDPWTWVGRGHLLMTTGLGVPRRPADQVSYVERLADVGAAGVAIGENMHAPPLTDQMLAVANERRLPLLLTRRDIPFIAVARAVAEASQRDARRRISQTAGIYEVLRAASLDEPDPQRLVSSFEGIVGCRLVVADHATGRLRLGQHSFPESTRDALRRHAGGARPFDDGPVELPYPGGRATAVAMPGPRPAFLVALCESDVTPDNTVLRHLAAATALSLTWVFAQRERARRLGASLLAQLIDQRLDLPTAEAQLAERGLGGRRLLLLACTSGDGDQELHHLHHALDDADIGHLMLTREPVTYVLLQDCASSVEGLLAALPAGGTVGASDSFEGPDRLPGAQREALWALHRAEERRLRLVRHSEDLGDSVFLPANKEDGRAAARRVLGPLFDYDSEHRSQLVHTLRVFLEENRSWRRASAQLHVHKQTLVYRTSRIEALTGRNLSSTSDVAEMWLALQAASTGARRPVRP